MSNPRKKIMAGLFSLLLVGVVVYFLNANTAGDRVVEEKDIAGSEEERTEVPLETKPVAASPESGKQASAGTDIETKKRLQEREKLAQEKQQQIDALIVEYDNHLSDREERMQLQAQINALMEEYNALVLPVAMAKLKAAQPEQRP